MIALKSKMAVAIVSVLLLGGTVTGLALTRDPAPTPQVMGTSTKVASLEGSKTPTNNSPTADTSTSTNTNSTVDAPAISVVKTTGTKSSTTNGATNAVANAAVADAPATTTTTTTSNTSGTTTAPAADPTTTPAPSYKIVLRPNDASVQDLSLFAGKGTAQIVVPFDLVYDTGFNKTNFQQSDCLIATAPTANSGVTCILAQKEADTGSLVIQYNNASAVGSYVVKAIYSINNVVRTDTFAFDLQ